MKKFLIIAAIVVVVVIIVFIIIFATKGKQLVNVAIDKGFSTMESVMLANRPASVPEDSIRTVIDSTIVKIKMGEVDPTTMRAIMMKFKGYMDDKKLDSLEVMSMLEEMNAL